MTFPSTIVDHNVYQGGESFFGKIVESKLPDLNILTENFRGAGMAGPVAIDLGMQEMMAEFTIAEWNERLLGLIGTRDRITARPGERDNLNSNWTGFIMTMGGLWTSTELSLLKPGQMAPVKVKCAVDYYKGERGDSELFEIDFINGKRVIGGVDQEAGKLAALGL